MNLNPEELKLFLTEILEEKKYKSFTIKVERVRITLIDDISQDEEYVRALQSLGRSIENFDIKVKYPFVNRVVDEQAIFQTPKSLLITTD